MRILLGGDVMLGQLVRDVMRTEGSHYPLAKIANLFKRGDLSIINLECAITNYPDVWSGAPKAPRVEQPPFL